MHQLVAKKQNILQRLLDARNVSSKTKITIERSGSINPEKSVHYLTWYISIQLHNRSGRDHDEKNIVTKVTPPKKIVHYISTVIISRFKTASSLFCSTFPRLPTSALHP